MGTFACFTSCYCLQEEARLAHESSENSLIPPSKASPPDPEQSKIKQKPAKKQAKAKPKPGGKHEEAKEPRRLSGYNLYCKNRRQELQVGFHPPQ